MQLFFIDESGTIPPKNKSTNSEVFALGGVIIPEDLWLEVNKELVVIKNKYKINGEIKWRYFSSQKEGAKEHELSHLNSTEKEKLRIDLYNVLKRFKAIKSICAVVSIQKAYSLDYVYDENDLYWFAYKQMTERFQYYLQDLTKIVGSKINGIGVCDHRQPKDDGHLRHAHHSMVNGTQFGSTYKNLIETVFIAPSHLSIGIQFADLVGGAVYRKFARQDDRYFNIIEPLLRRSSNGQVEGYGLIKWPK